MQDPTVFDKANKRAITNEKVWGHRENKVWRTTHLSQSEGPSLHCFQNNDQQTFWHTLHATQHLLTTVQTG